MSARTRNCGICVQRAAERCGAPEGSAILATLPAHGARASGFWGELESEDGEIETALKNEEDLTRYEQLTHVQDE